MASGPPAADDEGGSPAMSPAQFEQVLHAATASNPSHGFGPPTALIVDLRHALAGQVSRREFDQGLRHLRDEGGIALEPHPHPEFLGFEVVDVFPGGEMLLFLLRWLK